MARKHEPEGIIGMLREAKIVVAQGGTVAAGAAYRKDYTANRYQGADDEYDPDRDWSGALADLRICYRLGRTLAESGEWPNWLPGDEFRRARDESRAGR